MYHLMSSYTRATISHSATFINLLLGKIQSSLLTMSSRPLSSVVIQEYDIIMCMTSLSIALHIKGKDIIRVIGFFIKSKQIIMISRAL